MLVRAYDFVWMCHMIETYVAYHTSIICVGSWHVFWAWVKAILLEPFGCSAILALLEETVPHFIRTLRLPMSWLFIFLNEQWADLVQKLVSCMFISQDLLWCWVQKHFQPLPNGVKLGWLKFWHCLKNIICYGIISSVIIQGQFILLRVHSEGEKVILMWDCW